MADRSARVLSARTRIVGWLLALVALALAATLLIAAQVLFGRADRTIDNELTHESTKLRAYAANAVDADGEPFSRVDDLLADYLLTNLPESTETFFSLVDGRPDRRSALEPRARLDNDADFVAAAAANAATGQTHSGEWPSASGPVRYAVIPVSVDSDPRTGALVVVEFAAVAHAQVVDTLQVLGIISFAALAGAGVVSWLVAGRVLAPIRLVRNTAERISESDLGERIRVDGNDDVAQLAATFNRMLDRLEVAFAGQRQFLDDAGHELRTPLTVVRGHLELMSDEPEERVRTQALVMDELDRMSRIVDDLIVLAKVEQPDFLTTGTVELADLTVDVVEKARALGDRRWTVEQVADATVRADGQRLTQALMQLAMNAVQHTDPRGRIGVGSAIRGDRVELWVTDDGAGVAPEDAERIFDRFARGDNSRRRDGSGLGLAIVRSIAEAHHGSVRVSGTPGHGATFTLSLPLVVLDRGVAEETVVLDAAPTDVLPAVTSAPGDRR